MIQFPSDPDTVLDVRDLRTFFRTDGHVVKAVDGVSFTVRRGETLGLVGESGSGKSVACLSALRLLPSPPAFHPSGRILYRGCDLLTSPARELERLRGDRLAMHRHNLNALMLHAPQAVDALAVGKHQLPGLTRPQLPGQGLVGADHGVVRAGIGDPAWAPVQQTGFLDGLGAAIGGLHAPQHTAAHGLQGGVGCGIEYQLALGVEAPARVQPR